MWPQKHLGLAGVKAVLREVDSGPLAGAAPGSGCALALLSPSLLAPSHSRLSQDTVCSRNRACVCSGRPTGPCSAPRSLSRPDKGSLCPQLPLPHDHRPQGSHQVPRCPPQLCPCLQPLSPHCTPWSVPPSLSPILVPNVAHAPDNPHPGCPLASSSLISGAAPCLDATRCKHSCSGVPAPPPLCPTQGGRPS